MKCIINNNLLWVRNFFKHQWYSLKIFKPVNHPSLVSRNYKACGMEYRNKNHNSPLDKKEVGIYRKALSAFLSSDLEFQTQKLASGQSLGENHIFDDRHVYRSSSNESELESISTTRCMWLRKQLFEFYTADHFYTHTLRKIFNSSFRCL